MTFRERLADWISGGVVRDLKRELAGWKKEANEGWGTALDRLFALQDIIACETQHANATVRRMAKIAKDALK